MSSDERAPIRDAYGHRVTPGVLLAAYRQRCFPMADQRAGIIDWFRPEQRAVITWDHFRVPRSLRKTWRQRPYRLSMDRACTRVIAACADRDETWISHDIERLYGDLHARGVVHSIEAWDDAGLLVGGLYGLAIGGCFCGESMFHRAPDAAKLCVMLLVHCLRRGGFSLLDCQQQSPHMQRFGARMVTDAAYARLFDRVVEHPCLLLPPSADWWAAYD